jgi:hypothetical protein
MTSNETAPEIVEGAWYRSGNLLYTLQQNGWNRGEPRFANRLEVRIHGTHDVPADELEGLAARLEAFLKTPSEDAAAAEQPDLRSPGL